MRYRRAFIPGGSFFFTVVTDRRRPLLASADAVNKLREAFRSVRARHPFSIDAIVVLPDHLHCIWTLPASDADFATRWRLIKTWFTKHRDPEVRATSRSDQATKAGQAVWQRRYWEHWLRDEEDFTRHVEYIHYNPVKHGHSDNPGGWRYTSFHRYVEAGVYPEDWGSGSMNFIGMGKE